MSETPSMMIPLGTKAPEFTLTDVCTGQKVSLHSIKSNKATVIMFICNHCPYVIHIRPRLLELISEYQQKGIVFIAINSNDVVNYPSDHPDKMREDAIKYQYRFPYLFDEDQSVAKAYHAACTPDFFIFDKELACIYRGRFDAATPKSNKPVTGEELKSALDCVLNDKPVTGEQYASLGCNIKWKK